VCFVSLLYMVAVPVFVSRNKTFQLPSALFVLFHRRNTPRHPPGAPCLFCFFGPKTTPRPVPLLFRLSVDVSTVSLAMRVREGIRAGNEASDHLNKNKENVRQH
jgi:hypothetical protein